jgi:hypothetical protein
MDRFVSATGQFLLATYEQFSCPPMGSFSCPLTIRPCRDNVLVVEPHRVVAAGVRNPPSLTGVQGVRRSR